MVSQRTIDAGEASVRLSANATKLVRELNRGRLAVSRFGEALTTIGRNLTIAGAAITAPFLLAFQVFRDFDDEIKKVKALTSFKIDDSPFEDLRQKILTLGRDTSFTASQVAKGARKLAQSGFASFQIQDALPNILNLARAGFVDLSVAADLAGRTMHQFQLSVDAAALAAEGLSTNEIRQRVLENTERVADVLAFTAGSAATTLELAGSTLSFVGVSAESAGQSLEDVSAAIGTLANRSIRGSRAGTGLRRVLTALATSAEGIEVDANTFVPVVDAQGAPRRLQFVLRELYQTALDRLGSKLKVSALFRKLFDLRGAPIAEVLGSEVAGFDRLRQGLDDNIGLARNLSEIIDEGVGGAIRRMLSAVENIKLRFFAKFEEEIIDLINHVTSGARAISDFIERNGADLIKKIALIGAGMVSAGLAILALGSAVKTVGASLAIGVSSIAAAASGVVGFFGPLGGMIVGAGTAMLGMIGIANRTAAAVGMAFNAVGTAVGGTISNMVFSLTSAFQQFKVSKEIGDIQFAFEVMANDIRFTLATLGTDLQVVWNRIIDAGIAAFSALSIALDRVIETMSKGLVASLNNIIGQLSKPLRLLLLGDRRLLDSPEPKGAAEEKKKFDAMVNSLKLVSGLIKAGNIEDKRSRNFANLLEGRLAAVDRFKQRQEEEAIRDSDSGRQPIQQKEDSRGEIVNEAAKSAGQALGSFSRRVLLSLGPGRSIETKQLKVQEEILAENKKFNKKKVLAFGT